MIYIILAHHTPVLLRELVDKIDHEHNHIVIHIDKSKPIEPFKTQFDGRTNCHFIEERYITSWGTFAIVEATISALKYVRYTIRRRQRVVLLSGTDYPIKSNKYITAYLRRHKDTIFIQHERIPRKIWDCGGKNRFPLYEKVREHLELYGGSQWFSIPSKALTIILRYLKENPDFMEYFRYVKIPDESFFQTLLLNCKDLYIQNNLRNENLHFIKWDKPYLHPRVLTYKDFNAVSRSKDLFARKIDLNYSRELKEQIDSKQKNIHVQQKKQIVVLFLTNKPFKDVQNRYTKLKSEMSDYADVFMINTRQENYIGTSDQVIYEHKMCFNLGYTPFESERIIPGSTYFAALYFSKIFSKYTHYWLVEDDVWFNGSWASFFKHFEQNDADYIGSYHVTYREADHWFWWKSIHLNLSRKISDEEKVRTFYPICRFSIKALYYLDQMLKNGNHGHGEVLMPTLLKLRNFKLFDIAKYISSDDKKQSLMIPCSKLAITEDNDGSFRYRPEVARTEIAGEYLFHPVKEDLQFPL